MKKNKTKQQDYNEFMITTMKGRNRKTGAVCRRNAVFQDKRRSRKAEQKAKRELMDW